MLNFHLFLMIQTCSYLYSSKYSSQWATPFLAYPHCGEYLLKAGNSSNAQNHANIRGTHLSEPFHVTNGFGHGGVLSP